MKNKSEYRRPSDGSEREEQGIEREDVEDVGGRVGGGYRAGRREEESDPSGQGESEADSEQVTWPGRRRE